MLSIYHKSPYVLFRINQRRFVSFIAKFNIKYSNPYFCNYTNYSWIHSFVKGDAFQAFTNHLLIKKKIYSISCLAKNGSNYQVFSWILILAYLEQGTDCTCQYFCARCFWDISNAHNKYRNVYYHVGDNSTKNIAFGNWYIIIRLRRLDLSCPCKSASSLLAIKQVTTKD